jgi:hypothetical protein
MSQEQRLPINPYEDVPGAPESKPTDLPNPVLSSASDNLQSGLQSLRGNYGQASEPVNDPQARYNDFKSEQLQGNYGQNTDTPSASAATHERDDMGESKY